MIYCKINQLLKSRKKTALWLAEEMNCSVEYINDLIDNTNATIAFDTIERLCDIFNCSPNDLFTITND